MSSFNKTHTIGALALGASLLVSSGCAETDLIGQADDTQLQNLDDYQLVALGGERELNDVVYSGYVSQFSFPLRGLSDGTVNGAAGAGNERLSIGDVRDRPHNSAFGQIHEAIWSNLKVVDLGFSLIPEDRVYTNRIVARALVNAGYAERMMADHFCEATFAYSPLGGYALEALDQASEDPADDSFLRTNALAEPLDKVEMYQRAAYEFQQAIDAAEATIANGDSDVIVNDADPDYFEPEQVRLAAYAGLAQANHALALLTGDNTYWAEATAASAVVPTDFVHWFNTDPIIVQEVDRYTSNWLEMWTDNEISVWSGEVAGRQWGSAVNMVAEPDDPRHLPIECHDFNSYDGTIDDVFQENGIGSNLQITLDLDGDGSLTDDDQEEESWRWPEGTADCDYFYEPGWAPMELDLFPRWIDERWGDASAGSALPADEIAAARGTWMRMIEAEAALRVDGDIGTFVSKVDEARAERGAPALSNIPTTIGEMEYPNAMDDAMSVLDAEVLLEHYGESRRFSFLHNWQHPFITENHTTLPYYQDLLEGQGAGYQRASCLPIPQDECNLNAQYDCEVLTGG